MDRKEFKNKYLTNAFFFIEDKEQFETLQNIGIEFGLKNPIGGTTLMEYDMYNVSKEIAPTKGVKVAKNLTFFPDGRFQQSGFWVNGASYGDPKNYELFMTEYKDLEV